MNFLWKSLRMVSLMNVWGPEHNAPKVSVPAHACLRTAQLDANRLRAPTAKRHDCYMQDIYLAIPYAHDIS